MVIGVLLAGVASAGAFVTAYFMREPAPALSMSNGQSEFVEPGSVPIGGPFTLVDHTGQAVTQADFRGNYLLVFFGFTHCPDICPTSLAEIAQTMDLLAEDADAVRPLFISVDPERDTPEVLAEYVTAFHPRLVGLTGTPEQIAAVAQEYRTWYEKQPVEGSDDYMVSHQSNTYLMSPQGEYLTHFSYGTPPKEMAETIRNALVRFGDPSEGGGA
ncbi:SCO family protein [Chelativorans intermedius]|uniref:SCO family protein n=1 Tax=Chelativorans intermedius TaxID=515947 RepID=A0ABV6DBG9_9HYPH